ncbi:MAG TPA: DMT family transporter [Roseiflexaceae bacterium]|nr:DMT family transporter [Roseiflexaceae bacterium]
MHHQQRTGFFLTVLSAVVWSLTSPGLKYLLDTYGVASLAVAFWRDVFMAAACVLLLAVLRPSLLRVSRHDLRGFALLGAISIGIYHALWVASVAINGAAVAIVLIYTFPTFVTIGSWLLYREPLRWSQVLALVLALLGCALLVRVYDPAVLRLQWLGTVIGIATGITHACYVLFSQRAVRDHSPWTSLTYTMLFGALALLVMALVSSVIPGSWNHNISLGATAGPWLVLLFIALGPTLVGYAIFTAALRYIPGQIASLIVILEVPLATLMAMVFLHEQLEWPQVVGIGMILSAIVLPRMLSRRQPVAVRQAVVDEQPAAMG